MPSVGEGSADGTLFDEWLESACVLHALRDLEEKALKVGWVFVDGDGILVRVGEDEAD